MIRMIGSRPNLVLSWVLLLPFILAATALPSHAKPAAPEPALHEAVEFKDGIITQTPFHDTVTKKLMISINNKRYVLSPAVAVWESGLDSASALYEKAVNTGALSLGQKVTFEVTGVAEPTIERIVIDLLPHGN